jgi:uncharacterized membrane protein YeaQ/YmgE (transglycosylase-associated protein family)
MHWVNVAILLCVGNMVGWLVAIYVKGSERYLLGHILVSTLGAFIAGYLSLIIAPQYGASAMLPAGYVGAGILLYLVRFKKWRGQKETPDKSDP